MKKLFTTSLICSLAIFVSAQNQSITQEQLEFYNNQGNATASYYEATTSAAIKTNREKANCTLDKIVYGWHPYWSGSAYLNYDWDLLTHLSFFSYEVNPSTGNADNTHGWATSAAVNAALAANKKVTLTVTLFSNHATFLGNSTSQQTLITNLINLIQSRGAHGVNIDFEGLPVAQKTNFANFMVNLSNQMHAAIPNSEVSTVLYAVDWNNVFDFTIMNQAVNHYIIMGYDYYWSGSTTAGPNDPLYHYNNTYNYTLSKSITDYLSKGCTKDKLILGLPYYGREWQTASTTIPSSASASGVSKTYAVVKNNTSGYYSAANRQQENDSYTDVFVFNDGATKQCFISLENNFKKRLQHVRNTGIAGIGIWALGYDDGYNELWEAIEEYMTDCYASPCSGTIHDFGGPTKDYYNNENYTWTIAPTGATALTFNFSSFNLENNYDYLYIYDGATITAPQITGSPFTGTNSPGTFTSSTGAVTFRFVSDGATTAPGFLANYTCATDNVAPTSSIAVAGNWQTTNFNATFTDTDNTNGSGIDKRFYQVIDFDGNEWRANPQKGFYNDAFNQSSLHADWTNSTGTWNTNSNALVQSDEANSNTNLYAALNQNNDDIWLHEFSMKINGSGTTRRAGYHFMCDDPTLPNRGNSYFIWLRADDDKVQIYEVENDVFSLKTNDPYTINTNQWYAIKTVYNKLDGKIEVWIDGTMVSSWVDATPITVGNAISFRTGNASMEVSDLHVYHNRTNIATITVGANETIRYQNPNPSTPAGMINSLAIDYAKNISITGVKSINIDWTPPSAPTVVNDGLSTDQFEFEINEISANWSKSIDTNSGIYTYYYAIGTTPLGTDIVDWTNNGLDTFFTTNSFLSPLVMFTTYYTSVIAHNGVGLSSVIAQSNGQMYNPFEDLSTNNLKTQATYIAPNPFSESIHVHGMKAGNKTIVLTDITGRIVYQQSFESTDITIEQLKDLKAGTYFVSILLETDKIELMNQKIVKQ
ncbi:MAG: glycosyl hydrolase family 18 protein [Crocinitomicaceae bacterium]|nr:glycosyl hydrolase family 18 protein [Crocinitomicaceae bacterium]